MHGLSSFRVALFTRENATYTAISLMGTTLTPLTNQIPDVIPVRNGMPECRQCPPGHFPRPYLLTVFIRCFTVLLHVLACSKIPSNWEVTPRKWSAPAPRIYDTFTLRIYEKRWFALRVGALLWRHISCNCESDPPFENISE